MKLKKDMIQTFAGCLQEIACLLTLHVIILYQATQNYNDLLTLLHRVTNSNWEVCPIMYLLPIQNDVLATMDGHGHHTHRGMINVCNTPRES